MHSCISEAQWSLTVDMLASVSLSKEFVASRASRGDAASDGSPPLLASRVSEADPERSVAPSVDVALDANATRRC
jgi:hypothetical protein